MWRNMWQNHPGKLAGIGAGLFFGILYLFTGFWDMLFLALLVSIGFLIGRRYDRGEPLVDASRLFEWLNKRWRMFR